MENDLIRRKLIASALLLTVLTACFALFGSERTMAVIGLLSLAGYLWKLVTINPNPEGLKNE